MKLTVVAHPRSQTERVEQLEEYKYAVYFNVAPEAGKANRKLCELLAQYFSVAKSKVIIRAGERAHTKIVEIVEG